MHPQVKRKATVAGLPSGGRNVKRRASKACHCCRSRKVRCDVVESGIPCTNCRLDEVDCVVTQGRRRRKPHGGVEDVSTPAASKSLEKQENFPELSMFDSLDGMEDFNPAPASVEPPSSHGGEDYDLSRHIPHMLYQRQGHKLSQAGYTRRVSASTRIQPSFPHLPTGPGTAFGLQQVVQPENVLPEYIKPLPPRIASEDLDYLHRKGVFLIPDRSPRNELLRCYVQYVHPYLPVLDLEDFLTRIEKAQPHETISLLLFHAVMFAATAYVDLRFLAAQGYPNRKTARKAYFEKVKLLYDFNYEADRVTVVQSVLLMTHWYENPDDTKDIWHWLGIALSVGRTIGLNCDTSNASLMSMRQRRLWKRIWWCCFMRDRSIALGMRRPMRIQDGDFDVPMLEVTDFEIDEMPSGIARMLGGCPVVRDVSKRVTLARMCIGVAQLCVQIGHVLNVQYSILGHKMGASHETTMRLVPKKTAADPGEMTKCDQGLEQWYKSLPHELLYFAPDSSARTSIHDGEVIFLHRALLTSIYLTAVSALHRPQILPPAPNIIITPEMRQWSKGKVREAADSVTEIYQDLHSHDLIRFLPNSGVTCLLPAIIIHLLDIKSTTSSTRHASARKFQFCMQALQRLREIYSSADFASTFLEAAVRKTSALTRASSAQRLRSLPPENLGGGLVDSKSIKTQSSLLLTPPPEAQQLAKMLLFDSNMTTNEQRPASAQTPPESEGSLAPQPQDTPVLSLTDNQEAFEVEGQCRKYDGGENLSCTPFESLMSLEHDTGLFAEATEDGLELGIQWLDGFQLQEPETYDEWFLHTTHNEEPDSQGSLGCSELLPFNAGEEVDIGLI